MQANLRHIDTVVFDLDGTLVDSVRDVGAILQAMRAERSLPPVETNELRYWSSRGGLAMIRALLCCEEEAAGFLLAEFRSRYFDRPTDPGSLFVGAIETLDCLSDLGFRVGLCTNKPAHLTEKVLRELSIDRYFNSVVCGDTLPVKKPDPMPLHEVLRRIGGKPEAAIMVGDSTVDQRTATAAGVCFCFFAGGYDDGVDREGSVLKLRGLNELAFALAPEQAVFAPKINRIMI